jgi:hypothetical protein
MHRLSLNMDYMLKGGKLVHLWVPDPWNTVFMLSTEALSGRIWLWQGMNKGLAPADALQVRILPCVLFMREGCLPQSWPAT